MAELRRGDDGVWTLHRDDDERGKRNAVHDEALPRYVTAFDRVFTKAEEACESEFVKALIRVGGLQDPGWDPYESTLRAIPAIIALREQIPEVPIHRSRPELERLADAAHQPDVMEPIREIWDYDLRNAVFHADYSLYGGEVRIPRRGASTHDEIMTLVNRAIAYQEALAALVESYRRGYDEPKRVLVHPELATRPDETMVVMIREGEGAIGLGYVFTEEVAAGAIPTYLARLYPDEAAAVRADTTLVRLPARPRLHPPPSRLRRAAGIGLDYADRALKSARRRLA
jgi:hypothetical protein